MFCVTLRYSILDLVVEKPCYSIVIVYFKGVKSEKNNQKY